MSKKILRYRPRRWTSSFRDFLLSGRMHSLRMSFGQPVVDPQTYRWSISPSVPSPFRAVFFPGRNENVGASDDLRRDTDSSRPSTFGLGPRMIDDVDGGPHLPFIFIISPRRRTDTPRKWLRPPWFVDDHCRTICVRKWPLMTLNLYLSAVFDNWR